MKRIKEMHIPDALLLQVEKPGRYIGNEVNMVVKSAETIEIHFGLCFPDVYEIAMSNIGMQILYGLMNEREATYVQRLFAPWPDMEAIMRAEGISLYGLETLKPAKEFDILGFTLQYEMNYTNIINMLSLSELPFLARDRGEEDPIICAGGPCACNPEPLAELFDFIYLGDAEASLNQVLDIYGKHKKKNGKKADFLEAIKDISGIYIPSYFDISYQASGEIERVTAHTGKPIIHKAMMVDMDKAYFPEKPLVPNIEIIHDRTVGELFRGCIRGCRFCQAGYVYRPTREKSKEVVREQILTNLRHTGHDEVSLVSLSSSDYTEFNELVDSLLVDFENKHINISLPSLRIDATSLEIMGKVQQVRKSSLTFAPEAGSQRLRDVVNKNLTEIDILSGAKLAFESGWDRMKLYFMFGLPTETEADLLAIVDLLDKIVNEYFSIPKENRKRGVNISASGACFVPKAHTPFQWVAQDRKEVFMAKGRLIKKSITRRQVSFSYHEPSVSVVEGVLARGDRRVLEAIIRAWELGARFDGWSEYFKESIWEQAFLETGISLDFYTYRNRSETEIFPWDHIHMGVDKSFLLREYHKALEGKITKDCRVGCSQCGLPCVELGLVKQGKTTEEIL